ncbi:hypothetical protein ACHHYP_16103 [Achlya hypogyna]|uniref:MYND-type domain-containing protein n=1 Tax=Achlya hypogyna TaxID=1202772 RepID=A0A1V9ZEK1_ACHHY|nr:hypothetical protein ACHHYP_16103 [Achlya hypogyna]
MGKAQVGITTRPLDGGNVCSNCGEQTKVESCPGQCGLTAYCSSLCLLNHKPVHHRTCQAATPRVATFDDDDELVANTDDVPLLDDIAAADPTVAPVLQGSLPQYSLTKTLSSLFLLPAKIKKFLPSDADAVVPETDDEVRWPEPFTSPRVNVPLDEWARSNIYFNQLKFLVYQSGPAGFQLATDPEGLVVHHVTSSWVWAQGIRIGDRLERIGGMATTDLAPDAALHCLYHADLPTVLRFRSPSRVAKTIRRVLLEDRLGITFAGDGPEDIPVVNRVLRRSGADAATGDVLVLVGDAFDAIEHGLAATLRFVAQCPRPVALTFQRLLVDASVPRLPARDPTELSEADATPPSRPLAARGLCTTVLAPAQGNVVLVWRRGLLGLTFVECPASGLLQVSRLTGKGATPLVDRLQPGHRLTAVNGVALAPFELAANCARLAAATKPALLVFQPPPGGRSARARSSAVLPSKRVDRCLARLPSTGEYEVLWAAPPLGVVLRFLKGLNTPVVKRLKPTCALRLNADAVGHALVAVNNIATTGLSSADLARLLQSAGFPVVLRFRRGESADDTAESLNRVSGSDGSSFVATAGATHNVVWRDGSLGLTLEPTDDGPRVKRLSADSNLAITAGVGVGDALAFLNGKPLPPHLTFQETMALLLSTPKPLVLGFCKAPTRRSSESL